MRTLDLLQKVENVKVRSAWNKGVKEYAIELLDDAASNRKCEEFASLQELKEVILNVAENWMQYSEGGCSLIYNTDIAERLCSPSELKRTKNGMNNPNSRENWVQCQARALFQAWEMIKRVYTVSGSCLGFKSGVIIDAYNDKFQYLLVRLKVEL